MLCRRTFRCLAAIVVSSIAPETGLLDYGNEATI